jgi:hypothetical protein
VNFLVNCACTRNADCDDGNICTTDICNNTVCEHIPNSLPCNDGKYCNGADTCSGGLCSIHAGDPCAPEPNTTVPSKNYSSIIPLCCKLLKLSETIRNLF